MEDGAVNRENRAIYVQLPLFVSYELKKGSPLFKVRRKFLRKMKKIVEELQSGRAPVERQW